MTKIHHVKPVISGRFGTGWIPDTPDQRDIRYKVSVPSVLADKVDLRNKMRPIEHQGTLGACTGFGIGACFEYLKEGFECSYLMLYYNERAIENTIYVDNGAQIRSGIKTLNKLGVCSEEVWPYDISKFSKKPSKNAYTEASENKIATYARLDTLKDVLQCLHEGYPVVFGAMLYESFETSTPNKGLVSMPAITEAALGGHCMVWVGYDMASRLLITRNSWGEEWGDKGYCYFPFDYASDRNLCDDIWVIKQ